MDGEGSAKPAEMAAGVCNWCRERIDDPSEREVHVSLLGAPAEFHGACFEEYQASEEESAHRQR